MAGLRIGVDVGGTFTHGVVLRPPGEVIARSRTPTTHTSPHGVAEGVGIVLTELLASLDAMGIAREAVELVAHSTTQATNALLEGDVSPVTRVVVVPPGEGWLCRRALRDCFLRLGGRRVPMSTVFVHWTALDEPGSGGILPPAASEPGDDAPREPVAVIQPLAGGEELREEQAAAAWREGGHPTVLAGEITRVLGLSLRARTAAVNAAMLPTMLATAEYTEQAVGGMLPGVPLVVVRSDGGAMAIGEMRRMPVMSTLSGPAAGAGAAVHLSGLAEAVFIEVGGTSTDVTLIHDGRVRQQSAVVGGVRLLVPALDLRTVAVGGGSMLRTDGSRFGPRSAHIAGLPYMFQAALAGREAVRSGEYREEGDPQAYRTAVLDDGSMAAVTLTDCHLAAEGIDGCGGAAEALGVEMDAESAGRLCRAVEPYLAVFERARRATLRQITDAVGELARAHSVGLGHCVLLGGGGGAPVVLDAVAAMLGLPPRLAPEHAVISAIGAALAVMCVSLSKTALQPTAADVAELAGEVERRLRVQGAERLSTQFDYDPLRQVLTVTGRGSRPYAADAVPRSMDELTAIAAELLQADARLAWQGPEEALWAAEQRGRGGRARRGGRSQVGCALDRFGRALWVGGLSAWYPAGAGERESVLAGILDGLTRYTDGGPVLPGVALVCDGRLIPLDALGTAELIAEALRWESLPADAPGCFIVRG